MKRRPILSGDWKTVEYDDDEVHIGGMDTPDASLGRLKDSSEMAGLLVL